MGGIGSGRRKGSGKARKPGSGKHGSLTLSNMKKFKAGTSGRKYTGKRKLDQWVVERKFKRGR